MVISPHWLGSVLKRIVIHVGRRGAENYPVIIRPLVIEILIISLAPLSHHGFGIQG